MSFAKVSCTASWPGADLAETAEMEAMIHWEIPCSVTQHPEHRKCWVPATYRVRAYCPECHRQYERPACPFHAGRIFRAFLLNQNWCSCRPRHSDDHVFTNVRMRPI